MINKNDVTSWFQTLESYKRIDVMCALLNICLPFELRFLGTCLEELGRRDSQELRGMELRVNNPQAVASDMHACQHSEPTDRKVRRKMALYLALIRACNRTCVNEIFRSLESWGELDFSTTVDKDTLQELLLVYTMAAHHPVFDFEQHMKCMQIFEKIKEHKLVVDPLSSANSSTNNQINLPLNSGMASINSGQALEMHAAQHQHSTPTSQPDLMHQHTNVLQAASMQQSNAHSHLLNHNHVQMLSQGPIPLNYHQNSLTKLISGADGINLQQSMAIESMPHVISSNLNLPECNKSVQNAVITHSNTAAWTMRQYPPPLISGDVQTLGDHKSSSPLMSQQSSPCNSRPTSPIRTSSYDSVILQTQATNQVRNLPSQRIASVSAKNVRRPSAETTPPPSLTQQQPVIMPNELIVSQNVKHITEVVMNNETTGNQLQNLIRNGFSRSSNYVRIKSGNYIPSHQQHSSSNQQHYSGAFTVNTGLTFGMQNMSMTDLATTGGHQLEVNNLLGINSSKSNGSDSGSSVGSSGELSPPDTPTLIINSNAVPSTGVIRLNAVGAETGSSLSQQHPTQQPTQKLLQPSQLSYNKQLGLPRVNGRSEKILAVNTVGGASSGVINTNAAIIYAHQQQQSQVHQQTTAPQAIYADVLLTPGNATAATVMQGSLTSNSCGVNNSNVVSSNNNMLGANTVLITSPSGGSANNMGNVITSNSLLLQTHQHQYNTSYSYHAAAAAAQHLIANAARPPLMTHNPNVAPPPHGTFRLPGFQIQPNGELYYQTFHPAGGIAFLSSGSPPGGPNVAMRTTNSTAAAASTPTATQPPTPQHIPLQSTQLSVVPTAATLLPSPYSSLTIGVSSKPMSCYNCGSQNHSGRECQEASMDDVTRSAIYKLDYSQAASGAGAGNITSSGSNISTNTQVNTCTTESTTPLHTTKLHDTNSLIISNTPAVATVASSVTSVLTTTASVNAK